MTNSKTPVPVPEEDLDIQAVEDITTAAINTTSKSPRYVSMVCNPLIINYMSN